MQLNKVLHATIFKKKIKFSPASVGLGHAWTQRKIFLHFHPQSWDGSWELPREALWVGGNWTMAGACFKITCKMKYLIPVTKH